MKYFTTDTHFGHPLVSVLRGFTTFDPGHTQYDALLSSQGRKAAEDWVKGVVLDDSRLNFRKAADTDAHDEAIVANINRIVGEDDELWILGDIGYRTSVRHLKSCLRQLRCRHLLSPEGARHEALNVGLDAWNLQPVSETQIADWFHAHATDSTHVSPLDMPDSPGPAPIDSAAQQEPGGSVSAAES